MHPEEDAVVISGVGGYFPKAQNMKELSTHLFNNEFLLETKWSKAPDGISNILGSIESNKFDNVFFGIHHEQALYMDNMQRLTLERCVEALMDAGVNPSEVKGKRVGCFISSAISENERDAFEVVIKGYGLLGYSRSMMANRVSFMLNLNGPSLAYEGNWIGGIEILKLACQAINSGEIESCLVGTSSLTVHPEFQWHYTDMGLASLDGSTRSFDANATGYGRSDGVVVFYLQKASAARRHYASILHVDSYFDGSQEGSIRDIDASNMAEFLKGFYERAGVDPRNVDFVEAYGSAVKDLDKKELEALDKVYCKNRENPLLIGSVKPNTGHSESSAAFFSIVKILIAMEHEKIPGNIQYKKPNPEIESLVNGRMKVVNKNLPWQGEYAAVNAIGVDCYYGHVLLKSNPKKKIKIESNIPRLILMSSRTSTGIVDSLTSISNQPHADLEYFQLIQDLYKKAIYGHLYRGYVILDSEKKTQNEYHSGKKRPIWFVYSGMGSQWPGMINDLMKFPVFAKAINKCQKVLEPKGIDLIHIISTDDKTIYDNILHSFVGIAAIQIALTDVLNSLGIVPDGIIGHSVGELGCAYADGCMTAEQMILSAYSRGRASLEADLIQGMMAATGLGYAQIKDKCPPSIEVACHNGPDSSTISGPTEDMEKFVKELQDQGTFARLVNVSNIAYHSRYIKPAAPKLLEYLKQVIPVPMPRSSKWISTSNPEENWDTDLAKTSSAEYHTNNLLSSVLFEEGLKHIPKDAILIEIAPHGLLQAILKRSVKGECINIAITQRDCKSGVKFFLESLGKLYLAGIDVEIANLYERLPYPVSKGTPGLSEHVAWEHSETFREMNYAIASGVKEFQATLDNEYFSDCIGHQLDYKFAIPMASYLNIVADILGTTQLKELVFENLKFYKTLSIPKNGEVPLETMLMRGCGEFEVLSEDEIIASGKLVVPEATEKIFADVEEFEKSEKSTFLSRSDFYDELNHRGQKYSGAYKLVKSVEVCEKGSVAIIEWNKRWPTLLEAMVQQFLLHAGERTQEIHVPFSIRKIVLSLTLLRQEKEDLRVTYNQQTNIISTEGIQIQGLSTTTFPRQKRLFCVDSLDTVPLFNPKCYDVKNLINLALQLTLNHFNNSHDQFIKNITITEIESGNAKLKGVVTEVLREYTKLYPTIASLHDTKFINIKPTYPHLLLLNDTTNSAAVRLLESSHAFLLARSDRSIQSYPQIVEVANQVVDGVSYSILRKANHTPPTAVITVKSDTLSSSDIHRDSIQWMRELKAAVRLATGKLSRIFLIAHVLPEDGISNFVHELRSEFQNVDLRLHFLLDKGVANGNPKDIYYQKIFKADLVLSVFKNGALSTNIIVPVNIKEDIQTGINIRPNSIKDCTVKYIGINLYDETLLPPNKGKNDLGNLDYVGVNKNGERVMGLARFDKDTSEIIADDILRWNVPEEWSLEDAGSAPHAYASAYYSLVVKGKLRAGDTVLINAAYTAIGIAAVSIANAMNCKTCVTANTEFQKSYLKKMFFLTDNEIYSCWDKNFKPKFMEATGGRGANVVLNCLTGTLLQESVKCLSKFGTFVQIGRYDLMGDTSIGMSSFFKNISFAVVNLNTLMNQPAELKERIRDLVMNGVNSLAIRPIARKIVEHQNISVILNTLSNPDHIGKILINVKNFDIGQFIVQNPDQFLCNSKYSYLVYGGTAAEDIDLAEWLVLRGARKIVIAPASKLQQPWLGHRLSLLQSEFNAKIMFVTPKLQTKEEASELLSKVRSMGTIHVVFLLSKHSNSTGNGINGAGQHFYNILQDIAPKATLVHFTSRAAGIFQIKDEPELDIVSVRYQKELIFSEVLQELDNILNRKLKNVLIKSHDDSDFTQEGTQALLTSKLQLMLPESLREYTEEYKLMPHTAKLVQLPTLSPREARELVPIFIIPGISGYKEIKELARNLFCPTYCALLPSKPSSTKEIAADIAEQMKRVAKNEVYNLVAVSWGGALTIEVARLLESEKSSIHFYFIDASPATLKAAVKLLGETSQTAEVDLLIRLLDLSAEERSKIEAAENWKERLKVAMDNCDKDYEDYEKTTEAITHLKDLVQKLYNYEPSGKDSVSGRSHLLVPSGSGKHDECKLTEYCKERPKIQVINGDHRSIIKSKETIEYINEAVQLK